MLIHVRNLSSPAVCTYSGQPDACEKVTTRPPPLKRIFSPLGLGIEEQTPSDTGAASWKSYLFERWFSESPSQAGRWLCWPMKWKM